MEDIHKYLEETKKNLNELVLEIDKIKSLRLLNEKATNSLVETSNALEKITQKIRPFQSVEIKKLIYIFFGISLVNFLILAALFVFTVLK